MIAITGDYHNPNTKLIFIVINVITSGEDLTCTVEYVHHIFLYHNYHLLLFHRITNMDGPTQTSFVQLVEQQNLSTRN